MITNNSNLNTHNNAFHQQPNRSQRSGRSGGSSRLSNTTERPRAFNNFSILFALIKLIIRLIQQLQNTNTQQPAQPLSISDKAKEYLDSNFDNPSDILDNDKDGKISAGDTFAAGGSGGTGVQEVTIDQALADTLNNLDAVSDDAPPGVQSLIEPSDAVRDYLDANFSTDAEIGDVDGGGEISMGDRISYTDDQGIQQTVTIDQALADTLNALDQTINGDFIRPSKGIEGNLIQPSNAVRDYLDTNYSTDAEIGDADGDGKINVGDVIIDQGEIVVTIDQALADELNTLGQNNDGVLLEAHH